MASAVITHNKGVITVRVGRAVEHISTACKTKAQLFDQVKYACQSKGARLSDIQMTDLLQKLETGVGYEQPRRRRTH